MKTKSKTKDKNGFNKEWKKQDNIIHLKSQIESTFTWKIMYTYHKQ